MHGDTQRDNKYMPRNEISIGLPLKLNSPYEMSLDSKFILFALKTSVISSGINISAWKINRQNTPFLKGSQKYL
jgi:hypothetical protein